MTPKSPRLSPPQACVRLAELAARAGGEWTPFVEPAGVRYALPARATTEVLDYLRPLSDVTLEPVGAARLSSARVFGDGAVLSADGRELARDVSHDFGRPFARHWLLDYADLRPPTAIEGSSAVVAVNLGAGYCHWLLEELPRLLAMPRDEVDNLILHAAAEPARTALLRRGGGENVVEARRTAHHTCAPLLVPALIGRPGVPTPAAVAAILDFSTGLGRGTSPLGERLYVSRAKAGRRRVANDAELTVALEAAGFATVHLEEMDWEEQIAAFRAARVIVAPHGAGLANVVFCSPGTRVVELVGRTYFNPTFWRLAALRGLDYRPIVEAGDAPLAERPHCNRLDMVSEVSAVLEAASGA